MDTWLIVLIVAAIALLVIAGSAILFSQRRSRRLREEFGPEYESTMIRTGSRREAEAELEARRRRVEKLRLKEISPVRAQEYAERWRIVQGASVSIGVAYPPGGMLYQRMGFGRRGQQGRSG